MQMADDLKNLEDENKALEAIVAAAKINFYKQRFARLII